MRASMFVPVLFACLVAMCGAMAWWPPRFDPAPHTGSSQIVDGTGHALALDTPAHRVVLLTPIVGDYATLDHGIADLAAVADFAKAGSASGLIARVYPAVASLNVIKWPRTGLDPEVFFKLRPGAILGFPDQAAALRDYGLPGIAVTFEAATYMQDGRRAMQLVGAVSDRRAAAGALVARSRARDLEILHRIAARTTHPRAIVIVGPDSDLFVPWHHYLNAWLSALGVSNAARRAGRLFGKADMERLLALDPDVIFLDEVTGDSKAAVPATLLGDPRYSILRAVRERRVYKVPTAALATDAVDDSLLLRWFAELVYPQQMDSGLRQQLRDTYLETYGYRLTDSEIDRALLMKDNGTSAGYSRFAVAETP